MNYEFPTITNFKDVEPYIDDNFSVKDKEGVTYINYHSMMPAVFPPVPDDKNHPDYTAAVMRREFRGIAFDTATGAILSRPFHKFFNAGDREMGISPDLAIDDRDQVVQMWREMKIDCVQVAEGDF